MLQNLKEIRKQHHYSCQHMADELGISKVYYWQIESGKRRLSYDLATQIAKIFNRNPDSIFLPTELTNEEQTI